MKHIVIRVDPERRQWWKSTIKNLLPGWAVYLWDEDLFDFSLIEYAIVWSPPSGMLASLCNLKAIISVGAGIAHITCDPTLPKHVPIIRTTGPALRQRMAEYVALHVLRIHRRLPEIEQTAACGCWRQFIEPVANNVQVGIMGMGNLGVHVARTLYMLGYAVRGLSRQGRPVDNFEIFTQDKIDCFAKNTKIIVSLLPETPATDNIIGKNLFSAMPDGSWIINAGRGSHVDDDALLQALGSGKLAGAVLDVFRQEPLPSTHAFWNERKILITSHTASAIEPAIGGQIIAKNILTFDGGGITSDLVDLTQGY